MLSILRMLFVALLCVGAGSAYAQQPPNMPRPVSAAEVLPRLCQQQCLTGRRLCAPGEAALSPDCLTRRLVCRSTCGTCLTKLSATICAKEGTPDEACFSAYGQCTKEETAAGLRNRTLISLTGGDGLTKDTAVIIKGARGSLEGVGAEVLWAFNTHSDWRKQGQALVRDAGRVYDRIKYTTPDGTAEAWFDITDFFGKMDLPVEPKKQ